MEIILNDKTVSEAIKAYEAEIAELEKKATIEDAEAALPNFDTYDLSKFLPKGTVAGKVIRAKKMGVEQAYGFVGTPAGTIFVPPSLMSDFPNNAKVAVLVFEGPRGKAADRIANLDDYISWHRDEVRENIVKFINDDRAEKRRWIGNRDPSNGWDEMKAKCDALGLELIEVKKYTRSTNYGGRGTDTYKFSRAVTKEEADKVLDVLGMRHESKADDAPYDHGHDWITLDAAGFHNDWCGPFTD